MKTWSNLKQKFGEIGSVIFVVIAALFGSAALLGLVIGDWIIALAMFYMSVFVSLILRGWFFEFKLGMPLALTSLLAMSLLADAGSFHESGYYFLLRCSVTITSLILSVLLLRSKYTSWSLLIFIAMITLFGTGLFPMSKKHWQVYDKAAGIVIIVGCSAALVMDSDKKPVDLK
jgi:hypothetical protein